MPINLVLVGIQGSGKGTEARKIAQDFGFSFFEMGQKLRNFTSLGHPRSEEVKNCLESGSLVSEELIEVILRHYIDTHQDVKGFIFDGIPRTPSQKALFDRVFSDYFVIFLDLSKEEALNRLANRRIDPSTGESFPADFQGDFSPFTGNKLVKRDDDNPEAVLKRIEIFYQNTLPLLALWANDGKRVYHINSHAPIDTVHEHVKVVLSAY